MIKTEISQVYWCTYSTTNERCGKCKAIYCNKEDVKINGFKDAEIKSGDSKIEEKIYWFDQLFRGGIKTMEKKHHTVKRPTIMLLTGPPGSGKSTLALELSYRVASKSLLPLYISFEADTQSLIDKADIFGWRESIKEGNKKEIKILEYNPNNRKSFFKDISDPANADKNMIAFWDKAAMNKYRRAFKDDLSLTYSLISKVIEIVTKDLINISPEQIQNLDQDKGSFQFRRNIQKIDPGVIVIDSLNIIESKKAKSKLFEDITERFINADLIICILDSVDESPSDWEFKADIILRLNYFSTSDYFLRNIEIVKARNQYHVLGKHQLKIISKHVAPNNTYPCDNNIINHRSHPYRNTGGTVIYPSIHYYLSEYRKRSSPTPAGNITESPYQIGEILKLPAGRCTGFIGQRGTHKSHLAYMHLLYNIVVHDKRGLIITLMEDEKKTMETLQTILKQIKEQNGDENKDCKRYDYISDYIGQNRLEILYFLPGYITPNEFFHRIYVSAHHMKYKYDDQLLAVFNSLDQIAPRFPLCSQEDIFISSIIEFFLGEHITSIFIAVEESDKSLDKSGLLPMADFILSFEQAKTEYVNFKNQFAQHKKLEKILKNPDIGDKEFIETVKVKIKKLAGGRPHIIEGFLELASSSDNIYFNEEGLYFSKPELK